MQVEVNLRLLGLVIMQNSLKPETTPVINQLHAARTRTVMITGKCSESKSNGTLSEQLVHSVLVFLVEYFSDHFLALWSIELFFHFFSLFFFSS